MPRQTALETLIDEFINITWCLTNYEVQTPSSTTHALEQNLAMTDRSGFHALQNALRNQIVDDKRSFTNNKQDRLVPSSNMYSQLMSQFRSFSRFSVSTDRCMKIGKFITAFLRILQQRVELYANDVQRNASRTEQLDEMEKTFANTVHDASKQKRDVELSDSTSSANSTERYRTEEKNNGTLPKFCTSKINRFVRIIEPEIIQLE